MAGDGRRDRLSAVLIGAIVIFRHAAAATATATAAAATAATDHAMAGLRRRVRRRRSRAAWGRHDGAHTVAKARRG